VRDEPRTRVNVAGEPQDGTRALILGRLQAALGLLLASYIVFHLWQQWPVLVSRDAWLERARHAALPLALKLALGAVALSYLVVGTLRRASSPAAVQGSPDVGLRRVRLLFWGLAVVFLVVHLRMVHWTPSAASTVLDLHARMTDQVGRPLMLAAHLLGLTSVCALVALGPGRSAVALGLVKEPGLLDAVGGALGAVLLFYGLQLLSLYAIGTPLFPFGLPAS